MITSCKKQKAYHWFYVCQCGWQHRASMGERTVFAPSLVVLPLVLIGGLLVRCLHLCFLFQDTVPERGCVDRLHLAGSENVPCVRKSVLIWKCLRGLVCLMKMYLSSHHSYHCIYIFISNLSCRQFYLDLAHQSV